MSKNELIEKLNLILKRYGEVCAVREKIKSVTPVDSYQRNVVVPEFPEVQGGQASKILLLNTGEHKGDGALDSARLVYESTCPPPKKPQEPKEKEFKKPDKPKAMNVFSGLTVVSIIISLFFFASLIFSNFSPEILWTLYVIIAIGVFFACVGGACVLAYFLVLFLAKGKEKIALSEFNKEQKEAKEEYNEQLKKHEGELESYKEREQAFLNEYLSWRAIYLEHLAEEEKISAQLEIDKKALIKDIEEGELLLALSKLNEVNDIVSDDYLPVLDTLISLIKNGRADTLKEAINLYEELLYKERQLQLEKEKEAQRRYEEEMRRQDEERRHREEMRILAEQEYQRQREESYRRQEEERRYREEENRRQAEESRRQAEARREESRRQHEANIAMYRERNATQRQCQSCANVSHCRMAFNRPNCASYKPR